MGALSQAARHITCFHSDQAVFGGFAGLEYPRPCRGLSGIGRLPAGHRADRCKSGSGIFLQDDPGKGCRNRPLKQPLSMDISRISAISLIACLLINPKSRWTRCNNGMTADCFRSAGYFARKFLNFPGIFICDLVHRSQSPRTISILPMIPTRSATK